MAAYTGVSVAQPRGLNMNRSLWVKHVVLTALAAADTLDLTLPEGVDKDLVPVAVVCYDSATPSVRDNDLKIDQVTNHNKTTGVTRFTATGAVAAGSTIWIQYVA